MARQSRLKRKQRRLLQEEGITTKDKISGNFFLQKINPLTANQIKAFNSFDEGKHLVLHGLAGTGKTFISLYLSLMEVIDNNYYKKVCIVRSTVPSRDQGFLPGSAEDKAEIYESPYRRICTELFERGDAYEILKHKGTLEFITTSYIRGTTIDDAIVIVDEIQNMSFGELDTIITRMGENTQIIFCGDFRQSDLRGNEKNGVHNFLNILKRLNMFEYIEFEEEDIVRSKLIREYIITKDNMGLS